MTTFLGSLTELPTAVIVLFKMTVLLGAGWILHFALFRRNPRWRVLVWRGVTAGMILLPVGELLLPKLQIAVAPRPVLEEPAARVVEHEPVTAVQPETYVAPVASEPVGDTPKSFSVLLWAKRHIPFLLLTGWGLIGLTLAVRVLCVTRRVRRVIRSSEPAPEGIRLLMEKVAEDLRCRARVDLRVTDGLGSPFLAGVIRPVLVLPERLTDERHAGELPAVFAHELAHLLAHDLVWIVVGKWLAVLWWFHPLAWTARAAYIGACEEVCDAVAADYVGGAPSYSRTLARAALELVVDAPAPGGIPMIRTSDITRRLRNLKRGIKAAALARPWVAVAILLGCVILVILGSLQLVRAGRRRTEESSSSERGWKLTTYYAFGPVIERWINDDDAGEDFSIDFDTGRLWPMYPAGGGPHTVRSSAGLGIDAFVDVSGKPKNIVCSNMVVMAADHVWDGDPEAIAKRLEGGKPGSPIYMSAEGELPKSYIFKTPAFMGLGRLGGGMFGFHRLSGGAVEPSATATGMGVLQILEMSDKTEPRGVRIRYKMIQQQFAMVGPDGSFKESSRGDEMPMPETWQYAFGPVIERWINDNDAGKDFGIDFDTGLLGLPLPEGAKGLDGIVDVSGKPKNIICSDMIVMAADHVWDGDPNAIAQRLEGGTPGSPIYMSAEGELPKSFLFKTDEGGMGVLQILEMSDRIEPRGVRIRYKLIQWEETAQAHASPEIAVDARAAEAAAEPPRASTTDISEGRVIRFPEDRSLGKLMVRGEGAYTHWDAGWEPLCEARGTVRVPAGKELRLEVGIEVAKSLSRLSEVEADDLHQVTLQGTEVRDDDLKHLAHLTGLRGLDLSNTPITDEGLKHLDALASLEDLVLTYTQITDAGVAQIANFRSLRGISLYGTGVTDDGLAPLKDLTSLKWLVVGRTNIGDRGLAHLSGLTAMERLSLQSTKITGAGLVHFKRMRSLKFLDVHNTRVGNAGLAHLKGLPALETLQLPQHTAISDAGLAHLADAPQLKSLFLVSHGKLTDAGLAHLAKIKTLESLHIGSSSITDAGLAHLATLTGLRRLSVYGGAVTDDGLANLTPLKSLQRLELHRNHIGGAGFVHLKALPLLRHLKLYDLNLTDVGFNRLGELAELETLALYFIATTDGLSDDDIVHLANLKRLKHLEINSQIVTDAGFAHLAALKELECVSAWGPKLTDESLSYLSNKDNLERLHITGYFTDEGLRHLEGLPSLSHLEINGSFSDEALARLKRETHSLQSVEVRAPPWTTVVPEGRSREPPDSG